MGIGVIPREEIEIDFVYVSGRNERLTFNVDTTEVKDFKVSPIKH